MNCKSSLVCLLFSLLVVIRAQSQELSSRDLLSLAMNEAAYQPEVFRQFKKSFVRPCVYSMGNCITTAQQERLLKHMKSLVALKERQPNYFTD